MPLIDALLPEFDREMGLTRRALEQVPDGTFDWQPHPTSLTLGRLAEHLCDMPYWATLTLAQASTIVDVALKTAREKNFQPLTVAVLDPGGHLVAFKREDKSGILRYDIAYGKAWGALGIAVGWIIGLTASYGLGGGGQGRERLCALARRAGGQPR